jgi:hypothetical protein
MGCRCCVRCDSRPHRHGGPARHYREKSAEFRRPILSGTARARLLRFGPLLWAAGHWRDGNGQCAFYMVSSVVAGSGRGVVVEQRGPQPAEAGKEAMVHEWAQSAQPRGSSGPPPGGETARPPQLSPRGGSGDADRRRFNEVTIPSGTAVKPQRLRRPSGRIPAGSRKTTVRGESLAADHDRRSHGRAPLAHRRSGDRHRRQSSPAR